MLAEAKGSGWRRQAVGGRNVAGCWRGWARSPWTPRPVPRKVRYVSAGIWRLWRCA